MLRQRGVRDPSDPHSDRRADGSSPSGFSFIEVLVAIVLVGTAVIATMVGLRATVIASRIGNERSQMLLWVQEGAEAVHREPFVACGTSAGQLTGAEINARRAAYQATLDTVAPPAGANGTLTVDEVQYLSVDPVTWTERWSEQHCDPNYSVALLDIRALSARGTSIALEVVVDG